MVKNKVVWELYPALQRLGQQKISNAVSWRVALNLNHTRPIWDVLNAERQKLAIEHECSEEFAAKANENGGMADFVPKIRAFEKAFNALLGEEVEWAPAAKIEAKSLHALTDFAATDIAPLIEAAVIVNPEGFEAGEGK